MALVALSLAAAVVYLARGLILLLLASATVAYLLNPIVKIAESVLIKRQVAVTVIYLILGLGILGGGYFLYPRLSAEIETLTSGLPFLGEQLDQAIDAVQNQIVERHPAAKRFFTTREIRYKRLNAWIEEQTKDLPALVGHLASTILATVLIPFFSYFFLRDSRNLIQHLLDRVPAAYIETSVAIWREIDVIVGVYLRGLALEGLTLGILAASGLWLLGVNYPLLLGALCGIASVVPYLGPILGGGGALLVGLIQFKNAGALGSILVLFVCLKLLDVLIIQPLAIGRGKELHPVLLIGSILVGGQALGIVGMIIAVPMVTIVQRIARLLFDRQRYSVSTFSAPNGVAPPIPPFVC